MDTRLRGDIVLDLRRSCTSSSKCSYPTCRAKQDLTKPSHRIRFEVLEKYNFFISDVSKVCPNHSYVDAWVNVFQMASLNRFSNEQINQVIEILRDPRPSHEQNAHSGKYVQTLID